MKSKRPPFVDICWSIKEWPLEQQPRGTAVLLTRTQRQQTSQSQHRQSTQETFLQEDNTQPSQPPPTRRLTTGLRQLAAQDTEEILQAHGNHSTAIASKWTCHGPCSNENKFCYRVAGCHYVLDTSTVARWGSAIDRGEVTTFSPPPNIHNELINTPVCNGRKQAGKRKSEESSPPSQIVINTATQRGDQDIVSHLLELLQSTALHRHVSPPAHKRQKPQYEEPARYSSPVDPDDVLRDDFFDWCQDSYGQESRRNNVEVIRSIAVDQCWTIEQMRALSDPQSVRYQLAIKNRGAEGVLAEIASKISQWHEVQREKARAEKREKERRKRLLEVEESLIFESQVLEAGHDSG